ncbi:MAG: hypothetical protein IJI45_03610 [Anaerolineaceae bacterium]|nr:hypothetical protein [Anaerolineaceae bacterium]
MKFARLLFTSTRTSVNAVYRVPIYILSLTIPCLTEYCITSYHLMSGLFSIFAGWVLVLDSEIKQE